MKSKKVYDWKPGSRIDIDANVAGKALEQIERKQGRLTPQIVLREATVPTHPLHDYFDWDDSGAARKWRLQQAGHLVRCITVTIEKADIPSPIRAFVSVIDKEREPMKVYVNIETAMSNESMRDQVLGRAKRELDDWRQRYHDLNELAAVFVVIDGLLEVEA